MKTIVTSDWRFRGCRPYIPIENRKDSEVAYYFLTDWIKATVPGGIHLDLYNAGHIPNPYYDMNSLSCEWTENRWWLYDSDIFISENKCSKKELVFSGLDYRCEIFIDGKSYGKHENMFTEKRIDITHIKKDVINVRVLFEGAVSELGQYGSTSDTRTQKSRFGYLWDFATRLVNIGIWQNVYIEYIDDVRLSEQKICTDVEENTGIVNVELLFDGNCDNDVLIELIAPNGDLVEKRTLKFENKLLQSFQVQNPALWYPNGMGDHPLYTVRIALKSEVYEYKTGIRSLRYQRNPGSPEDSLPYTVVFNGEPLYLKGNNKVPLDHLYGNVSYDAYEWCIKALVNENVNIVRVWGGGIIETEEFYNLCDENGILIWQDFIQSSSGIENIPSEDSAFLEKLADAAREAVKTKRNHVSLTIWTGGNELAEAGDVPVDYTNKNIAMLKAVVDEFDSQRLFLPSTPSGPIYGVIFARPDNYDVHGPWEYNSEFYSNFNNLKLLLHSEFGIGGPSASTKLFLKENVAPLEGSNANTHHAQYWYNSMKRDIANFGDFECTDDYVPYGQWIQAEALRYVIETERRLAPYVCGSMVWQLNEPWPNADCTNLMDYFGNPKMAYYWVKNAFSDCNVSLKYNSIYFEQTIEAEVCAHGDTKTAEEDFSICIYNENGNLIKCYDLNTKNLPVKISADFEHENQIIMVRLIHKGVVKDYFFSSDKEHIYRSSRSFEKAQLSYQLSGITMEKNVGTAVARVKNIGDFPAYFVHPIDKNLNYAIIASDAYFTLLPGEEKEISLSVRERCGLFFERPDTDADIIFDCING